MGHLGAMKISFRPQGDEAPESEVTTQESEVTTQESEVTTQESEVTTQQSKKSVQAECRQQ
jgi:hypothetical protein